MLLFYYSYQERDMNPIGEYQDESARPGLEVFNKGDTSKFVIYHYLNYKNFNFLIQFIKTRVR